MVGVSAVAGAVDVFVTRVDCARKLREMSTSLQSQLDAVSSQYEHFSHYISDFFMVLRLSKAAGTDSFTSLQDVISCYNFLLKSHTIGKSVKTDLVRNFLEIIERIRLCVKALCREMKQWERHLLRHITSRVLTPFKKSIESINLLLGADNHFPPAAPHAASNAARTPPDTFFDARAA